MSLMPLHAQHSLFRQDWSGSALLGFALALLSVGLIMVASASIDFAGDVYNDPWFFTKNLCIICFGKLRKATTRRQGVKQDCDP